VIFRRNLLLSKTFALLQQGFQRQSSLLFKVLSSVRSHQASPHLSQLLLRIDFNKYFSVSGGQLGGIAQSSKSSADN